MRKLFMALVFTVSMQGIANENPGGFRHFTLPRMDQEAPASYSSADHPNSVFVLHAVTSCCPWSAQNVVNINGVVDRFSSESRLQVLSIGVGDIGVSESRHRPAYKAWIERTQPNHPTLLVRPGSAVGFVAGLEAWSIPSTYVLNCKGELVYDTAGLWGDTVEEKVDAAIQKALLTQCDDQVSDVKGPLIETPQQLNLKKTEKAPRRCL